MRDDTAVAVGVRQQCRATEPRRFGRQRDGDARAPGRAGRPPDRDDPAVPIVRDDVIDVRPLLDRQIRQRGTWFGIAELERLGAACDHAVGDRRADFGGNRLRADVGGEHVAHAELSQPPLGVVVAREPDHGDARGGKSSERVAVEAPQIG